MGRECAIGEVQDTTVIADIDPGFGNAVNVAYVMLRHVAAGVSIPRPAPNPPQQPFPFRLLCQLAPIDEAGGDLGKHLFSLDDRLVDRMATLTPAARNGITGVMPLRMRKLQLAWLVTETLRRSMSYISASV
jgi:hypothetical protein